MTQENMTQEKWTAVDHFVTALLVPLDPLLESALEAADAAGLPTIGVSPPQGRLLQLLASIQGARSILELGTLGGYSTICLARALPPGGRLITLEAEPKHAEVARTNIARAGLANVVDIRVGRAIDTLRELAAESSGPFDMIFIDADKPSIPDYFTWALKLSRPGTQILVDNVVRKGALADSESKDPAIESLRRFHQMLAAEPRVISTTIQTVGSKGYDGFTLIFVKS